MLTKIISGGQTGVDIAGILAAKTCGISTAGTMPAGWITLDGPKPQYKNLFGMVEHTSPKYPPRTECNVRDSEATIQIAVDFNSAGEKLTSRLIKQYKRPSFQIDVCKPRLREELMRWLEDNEFEVVNVAGNSHKTSPSIGFFAYNYLVEIFGVMGYKVKVGMFEDIKQQLNEGIYRHC